MDTLDLNRAFGETFDFVARHADEDMASPVVVYKRETVDAVIHQIRPLNVKHLSEVAAELSIFELDIDEDRYRAVERLDRLRIFTVRENSQLLGYAIYFVDRHINHKATRWAVNNAWWLDPGYRGKAVGRGLLEFAERSLEAEGVNVVTTGAMIDNPKGGAVLESLGHRAMQTVYFKVLNGA